MDAEMDILTSFLHGFSQWLPGAYRGEVWGVQNPPKKILKALQNLVKLNPIVKTVKNC
jgi:hypothetical protein